MKNSNLYPRMHVSLYVSNIEKTVAFYQAFFGQKASKVKAGYAKFELKQPSLIISFVENKDKINPQFGHLGFQVETEDILKEQLERVKAAGLAFQEEMGTNCCYANQDKFWVSDPDGTMWEVYYFHEDVEFNDIRYTTSDASACCTPVQTTNSNQEINNTNEKTNSETAATACCDPSSGCC